MKTKIIKILDKHLSDHVGAAMIKDIATSIGDYDYMTKRKIIRGFVRWQRDRGMIDSLTIDYEAAEMYLDGLLKDE